MYSVLEGVNITIFAYLFGVLRKQKCGTPHAGHICDTHGFSHTSCKTYGQLLPKSRRNWSTFQRCLLPLSSRQWLIAPLKQQSISTRLHSTTSQKTVFFYSILTVHTSKSISLNPFLISSFHMCLSIYIWFPTFYQDSNLYQLRRGKENKKWFYNTRKTIYYLNIYFIYIYIYILYMCISCA
jgi:hypothetical protein